MQTSPEPQHETQHELQHESPAEAGWWVDLLLENFVRKNPLFLFSAGAVLLGAWLLNPPGGDGARDLWLLLRLFAVIQAYQAALLGAAILIRPRGTQRELHYLLLVLAPFLIDVTFTNSGVIVLARQSGGLSPALGLLALSLGAAWFQLALGLRLAGERLRLPALGALALGPLFVLAIPLAGMELAALGAGRELGIVAGCGVALLSACLAAGAGAEVVRKLAPGVIGGVLAHALATAWVYQTSPAWVLAPTLLVLGLALPSFWPRLAPLRGGLGLALPAVGVFLAGLGDRTPLWLPLLLGAALVQVRVLWSAPRSWASWVALAFALDLACCGATPAESFAHFGASPLEPLVLLGGSVYAIAAGYHPAASLSLGVAALALGGAPEGLGLHEARVLRLQLLAVLAFAAGWRWERARPHASEAGLLRLAGALVFGLAPACTSAFRVSGGLGLWLALSCGILLASALLLRSGLLASAALPAAASLALRFGPRSEAALGVSSLVIAFGCVGAGLWVSWRREQLLAWLARRSAQAQRAGPRRYRQATLLVALLAFLGTWALSYAGAHDEHWRERRAAHLRSRANALTGHEK